MAARFWDQVAQETGLHSQDKRVFGWKDGFFVTFSIAVDMTFRLHVYWPETEEATSPEVMEKQLLKSMQAAKALESAAKEHKLTGSAAIQAGQSVSIGLRGRGAKAVKEMGPFINDAVSALSALGIVPPRVCAHCRQPLDHQEIPLLIKGDVYPVHDNCADELLQKQAWGDSKVRQGSLITGILGAALAAILGAIPWAVVYAMGYMTSLVGILIGLAVTKGYDLLHGRNGRMKVAVVLLFVILSVVLGQAAGTAYQFAELYDELEAGLTANEYMIHTKGEFIYEGMTQWAWEDAEVRQDIFSNLGMGVFFAILGCSGMLIRMAKEAAPAKPKRLSAAL